MVFITIALLPPFLHPVILHSSPGPLGLEQWQQVVDRQVLLVFVAVPDASQHSTGALRITDPHF